MVFLTAFGDDGFGREIRDRYLEEGIDLRHARVVDSDPTGVALIFVGDDGENLIGVAMGANVRLTPGWVDEIPAEAFEPPAHSRSHRQSPRGEAGWLRCRSDDATALANRDSARMRRAFQGTTTSRIACQQSPRHLAVPAPF